MSDPIFTPEEETRLQEVEKLTEYLDTRLAGIGSLEYQKKEATRTGSEHAELTEKLDRYEEITGIPKRTKLYFEELKSVVAGMSGLSSHSTILQPQEALSAASKAQIQEQVEAFMSQEVNAFERYVKEGKL